MSIQHSHAATIAVAAIKGEPTALNQIATLDENDSEIQVVIDGGEISARVYYPSEISPTGYAYSQTVSISDPGAAELFRDCVRENQTFDPDHGLKVRPGLRIKSVL